MAKLAMIVDYKYCTGCHSCEISCRAEHNIPPEEDGIKVFQFGPKKLDDKFAWDYYAIPTDLCDLCEQRIEQDKKPLCALHCLANCIEVVPVEDVPSRMLELGDKVSVFMP